MSTENETQNGADQALHTQRMTALTTAPPTTYQFAADHAGVAVHFEGNAWFFTKYGQPQLDRNRDRLIARALLTAAIEELDAMEAKS